MRAAHIPAPGETVLGRSLQTFPGGKGANQAAACAKAGAASTHMLLALGQDAYGLTLQDALVQAGVHLHRVDSSQASGTAFICVSDDGENAITVAPGANEDLRPEHWPSLAGVSHLLLQLETPLATVLAYAQQARAAGICTVLNAAPAQALPSALLETVDVLVVNEGELQSVSACDGSIAQCLQRLQVPLVIVTLGSRGCVARHADGRMHWQASFAVNPVDTTGAGDTFCGSFVAALAQPLDLPQALQQASAAAALSTTRWGAQTSIPTHAEVLAFSTSQNPNTPERLAALRAYCGC